MNQNRLNIDLVEMMQLEKLPLEDQQRIIETTGASIFSSIMHKIIPMLSDADKDELEKLMEGVDNQDEISNFLKSRIDNFDKIVDDVVADFKSDAANLLNF
jgi:hypothetical protein